MICALMLLPQAVLWSAPSPHPSEYLGMLDLDPAGDCDGDGMDDLIAASGSPTGPGIHATVLSGSDGSVLWWIVPDTGITGLEFARVGDIDMDGLDDVAIGEAGYPTVPPCPSTGRVSVRSGLDGSILYELVGFQCLSQFGRGLESYPDVDGDGIRELVVTAPYEVISPLLPGAGVARMYSGGLGPAGMPLWVQSYPWILVPSVPGQTFPTVRAVSRLGDLTGDGYPDLVLEGLDVGFRVVSGVTGGLQYVLTALAFSPGGPVAPLQPSYLWTIEGDLDGDAIADIVGGRVSQPWLGALYFNDGVVVARSGANGFPLWCETTASTAADGLGSSIAGTADWDADGVPEVVVGRPGGWWPGQPPLRTGGIVQVRSGATGIPVFEFGPPPSSGAVGFGQSVCLVEDQNGDGLPEIGVSAPLTPVNGVINTGVVFLYTLCDLFGHSCPSGGPRLRCAGGPVKAGNAGFGLLLENAPPLAPVYLLVGTSDASWSGVPLPAPLPGSLGCPLRVSGDVILSTPSGATSASGSAAVTLPVPNSAALVGSQAFAQWVVFDAGASSFVTTPGVRLRVLP